MFQASQVQSSGETPETDILASRNRSSVTFTASWWPSDTIPETHLESIVGYGTLGTNDSAFAALPTSFAYTIGGARQPSLNNGHKHLGTQSRFGSNALLKCLMKGAWEMMEVGGSEMETSQGSHVGT